MSIAAHQHDGVSLSVLLKSSGAGSSRRHMEGARCRYLGGGAGLLSVVGDQRPASHAQYDHAGTLESGQRLAHRLSRYTVLVG
jgi:hypothetical protein